MLVRNKLPRKKSLKSKVAIDNLLKHGQKTVGDCFILFFKVANDFQFATLVGRKLGNAVERNRIKRLYKEAIRLSYQNLDSDYQIAIIPKSGSKRASFEQINAEINRLFKKINSMA